MVGFCNWCGIMWAEVLAAACCERCNESLVYEVDDPTRYLTPEVADDLAHTIAELEDPRRYIIRSDWPGTYYDVTTDLYCSARECATEFKVRWHAEALVDLLNQRDAGPRHWVEETEKGK